jgi:translation initiation factor 1A
MVAKKSSKNKKKPSSENNVSESKQIIYKDDMQQYGKITKLLGDRRVLMVAPDTTELQGHIQGKFRKRVWFSVGDVVLFSRRDFQDSKVDIIHKYIEADVKKLIKELEIPPNFTDESFGEGNTNANESELGIDIDDTIEEEEEIDLDEI